MKKQILIILTSILMFSCSSNENDLEKTAIESVLIADDALYGNGSEGIIEQSLIITNQTAWNDLLSKINSVNNVSNDFSETEIDFSKYKVIAVFDEIKSNGGHRINLDITSNSKNIVVEVIKESPKGNAITVIAQPFYIVKITKSNLPILFN